MKKVLIIGGSGTISSPIVELLSKDKDINLYVLNRGNKNNDIKNITYMQADIRNYDQANKVLVGHDFDCVINFVIMNPTDVLTSYNLFKNRAKQFIFISTVCAVSDTNKLIITEDTSLDNPYSNYGHTKAECEKLFLKLHKENNFPITIVRPSQTYTKDRIPLSVKGKTTWSVIGRMLKNKRVIVHGDGQSVWTSTHADDFALNFIPLVLNEACIGETFQLMTSEIHTWDMVYLTLARLLNVEYRPVYISSQILIKSKYFDFKDSINGDKRWSKIFDTNKIQKIHDLKFNISLEEGLKKCLDYYNENPYLKVEDEDFDKWCDMAIENYENAINNIIL